MNTNLDTSARRQSAKRLIPLALLALFHNVFSLVAILVLSRRFNFGLRCVLLHISVVNGLMVALTIGLGLGLYWRRVRDNLLPKLLLACIPAASFAALVVLYLGNYVSNARWGNNFNYQVLAQWEFRELLSGGQVLSFQVYLSVIAGVAAIFGAYLLLSPRIFRGLAELVLPARPFSLFANRGRTWLSLTLLLITANVFTVYTVVLADKVKSVGHLVDEPIIGFFRTETESAYDLSKRSLYPKLREQELDSRARYPRNQQFSRKNVIIIVVDSLRPDHMQLYGYERPTTPFLTGLHTTGKLKKVDLALATCPFTSCGVLSTMASKNWRTLISESLKLYEVLFDQGYQVNFILSGNQDWYGLKESFGTSISYYFDGSYSAKYTANDDRAIFEGLEPVAPYSGTPAFFYFHLMSPHYIGVKHDQYRKYNPSHIEGTWQALVSGHHDRATKINNYDNGVIQSDATVEEIFDRLRDKRYLDDAVVVILGDHGEGLGERGPNYYSHTLTLYQEVLLIPLLIYDTDDVKYANLEFATQTDVAPTIAARLGLTVPSSWQGRSLLDPNVKQYSFHETKWNKVPLYAVIERGQDLIYKYIHSGAKEDELYELVTDPHEQHNLMSTVDPAVIRRMKAKLNEYASLSNVRADDAR